MVRKLLVQREPINVIINKTIKKKNKNTIITYLCNSGSQICPWPNIRRKFQPTIKCRSNKKTTINTESKCLHVIEFFFTRYYFLLYKIGYGPYYRVRSHTSYNRIFFCYLAKFYQYQPHFLKLVLISFVVVVTAVVVVVRKCDIFSFLNKKHDM